MPKRGKSNRTVQTCRICKTPVRPADPEFPFCSERCRLLDLGNWASGRYRVAGPPVEIEDAAPPDENDPGAGQ